MKKIYLFFLETLLRNEKERKSYEDTVFYTWHNKVQNGQGVAQTIICQKFKTIDESMEWIMEAIEKAAPHETLHNNKDVVLVFNTFLDLNYDINIAMRMLEELKNMQYSIYVLHMSQERKLEEYWNELVKQGLVKKRKKRYPKELIEYAVELREIHHIKYKEITEKTGIPRSTLIEYVNLKGESTGEKKGKITSEQEKKILDIQKRYSVPKRKMLNEKEKDAAIK